MAFSIKINTKLTISSWMAWSTKFTKLTISSSMAWPIENTNWQNSMIKGKQLFFYSVKFTTFQISYEKS